MSTTIKSAGPETPLTIRDSTGVGVCIDIGDGWEGGYFPRADFLAAVATECNVRIVPADAIVIEQGELPEVMVDGKWATVGSETYVFTGAAEHRAYAAQHFAIADYIDAHPPVDEAMVDALADEVTSAIDASGVGSNEISSIELARRLYLAGVRIEAAK